MTGDGVTESFAILVRSLEDARANESLHELTRDEDWRPQLVGAVALALGAGDATHRDDLWKRIEERSWVAPQLAAVLSIIDSDFLARAQEVVGHLLGPKPTEHKPEPEDEQHAAPGRDLVDAARRHSMRGPSGSVERRAKAVSALLSLIGNDDPWARGRLAQKDVSDLLAKDIDRGGEIALRWKERLLARLPPRG